MNSNTTGKKYIALEVEAANQILNHIAHTPSTRAPIEVLSLMRALELAPEGAPIKPTFNSMVADAVEASKEKEPVTEN